MSGKDQQLGPINSEVRQNEDSRVITLTAPSTPSGTSHSSSHVIVLYVLYLAIPTRVPGI